MKSEGEGNKSAYIEHIGLFFFFVACAGVSIIVWVFNWICWRNQCCCCDFLHNPINKRIVWWTSFIFFLGLLACCISGFVTTNRFGFALQGSYCSFERFYYDSIYGQLKETYPKWEGFDSLRENLGYLNTIYEGLSNKFPNVTLFGDLIKKTDFYDGYYKPEFLTQYMSNCSNGSNNDFCRIVDLKTLPLAKRYGKILDAYYTLVKLKSFIPNEETLSSLNTYFTDTKNSFTTLKTSFLNEFYYYARIANGWGRVLTMIYFCLLLIAVTFAGVSMMFYVCLRNQGYLAIFMHVLWNIIRFFIFSFFFYGGAYGMCYLALRDAVAYVMFVFGENNLVSDKSYLVPSGKGKEFLNFCLINKESDYKNRLNDILTSSLEDFFKNAYELNNIYFTNNNDLYLDGYSHDSFEQLIAKHKTFINFIKEKVQFILNDEYTNKFAQITARQGGLFGSFNCEFLKSDLNMMYRTLYDLSVEARILCALSCCIGFFGAIAVYFFLLVLHHYNMDLFFDSGQSIFTRIDGNVSRKKISNKDPGYKKRKIRSEIELSSRNEEYSGVHKNDE